jgi:hypothetical protein
MEGFARLRIDTWTAARLPWVTFPGSTPVAVEEEGVERDPRFFSIGPDPASQISVELGV